MMQNRMNRTLHSMALLLIFLGTTALSQTTENFHPVMISSRSGQVDSGTRRLMVETFSEAIRQSSLKSLGQQIYGTSKESGFSGTSPAGPISTLRKMLINLDTILDDRISKIHGELRAPSSEKAENLLEFFWTSRSFGTKALPVNGSIFGMLFKVLSPNRIQGTHLVNPFAIQMGSQLISLETARDKDVPGGIASLADESMSAYSKLRDLNSGLWMPLYFRAGVAIDRDKKISSDFSVSLIPVGFTLPKETINDLSIESVTYNPKKENSDILHIRFQRSYDNTGALNGLPILKVNFGPLNKQTMESNVCTGDSCIPLVDSIPTINAVMTGNWFKVAFASVLSLNSFKMMISSLGIKLNSLEVDPASSELPVMVKTYTLGWKAIDNKRNIRPLNPLEAIQKSLIGDRVSEGLSNKIQPASQDAEKSINDALKKVTDLFH